MLVKPIALYGSELWTAYKPCYKGKSLDDLFELSFKSNSEFDKIHTRFCKYVLGVFSELGQFPLIITSITSCLNFWMHIIQSSKKSLISKAYLEQLTSKNDKFLWIQFIKNILQDLGFSHVWNNHCTFNTHALLTVIKNKLKERFVTFWKNRMLNDESMKKLRTYKVLKQNFGIESYLDDIYDKSVRKAYLLLESALTGLGLNVADIWVKNQKKDCTICNIVEEEVYFLCQCHKYASQKKTLYDSLKDSNILLSLDHQEHSLS